MAESDKDVNKYASTNNDTAQVTMSRRAFVKGTAISAMGTVLLDGLPDPKSAQAFNGEAKIFGPGPVPLSLSVNGRRLVMRADPSMTLVDVLRQGVGLTGTKIGCDRGACSACTVWVDGEVVASCMTLAFDVRGKQITTIEGLAQGGKLHPVQQAFVDHDALQCGFCTPGMVMSCAALVESNPNCTLEDVKSAVSGHLCRCGTYPNVFRATLAAAGGKTETAQQGRDRG
jgi:carbon-monoxide dehydrogenase small subunit/xanthine dehydrogenase YagT iron-sulfur-binding subunit